MSDFNWYNLKDNLCPRCSGDMTKAKFKLSSHTLVCNCGFIISLHRYQQIVSEMNNRDVLEVESETQEI